MALRYIEIPDQARDRRMKVCKVPKQVVPERIGE